MRRCFPFLAILFIFFCTRATAQQVVVGPVSGVISACAGSASVSPAVTQFTVSGTGLTGSISVQAPQYFEVSLSVNSGYQNSVTIAPSGGSVSSATIYVRSAATAPAGLNPGICTIGTHGSADQQVSVTASINALPVVNAVSDQTVDAGAQTTAINFTGNADVFKWTNDNPAIGLVASGTGSIPAFTAINNTGKSITAHITVTPYFNGDAYIADNSEVGATVIDTRTETVKARITTQLGPFGSQVSADGSRAYVCNAGANSISVINTATKTVLANVNVGGTPYNCVVTRDGSKVYCSNISGGQIAVINAADFSVSYIDVGNNEVWEVALSPDESTLYCSGGAYSIFYISTTTRKIIATAPTDEFPLGMAVSPDGKTIYAACYNTGDVSVIDVAGHKLIQNINTGVAPEVVKISPDGQRVYVSNEYSYTVSVIDTKTLSIVGTIPTEDQPCGLSLTPDGKKLYVVNENSLDVQIVDLTSNYLIEKTIFLGSGILSGAFSYGDFIAVNPCVGAPVTFTITVNPAPPSQITTSGTPSPLNTVYGTASAATTFSVTGIEITGNISITAPPGFEISTDDIQFNTTASLTGLGAGTTGPATIYIRLAAATHAGGYSGNIKLTAPNAADVNVAMPLSTVTPAPLTIKADDKTQFVGGPVPALTATYTGFVNGDTPSDLSSPPILTTTALADSPVGKYPISISGAISNDYSIILSPGVLTVLPDNALVIPNTFTPNGDGVNDTWIIKNLDLFPACNVSVYTRYGQKVYASLGYSIPWNGRYKGSPLPSGTFYYIIDLNNGAKALSGFVVILR